MAREAGKREKRAKEEKKKKEEEEKEERRKRAAGKREPAPPKKSAFEERLEEEIRKNRWGRETAENFETQAKDLKERMAAVGWKEAEDLAISLVAQEMGGASKARGGERTTPETEDEEGSEEEEEQGNRSEEEGNRSEEERSRSDDEWLKVKGKNATKHSPPKPVEKKPRQQMQKKGKARHASNSSSASEREVREVKRSPGEVDRERLARDIAEKGRPEPSRRFFGGENEGGAIVTEEVSTLSFFQEFTLGWDPKRIKKG